MNKKASRILGFLLLGGLISTPVIAQSVTWPSTLRLVRTTFPKVQHISTDSLFLVLSDSVTVKPVLLDAREQNEYRVSHLPGAVQIDPDASDLGFDVDKNAPIVVYCSVGYRSSRIAQRLADRGYTNVANLEGSIFKWANEEKPVERDGIIVDEVHPFDRAWGSLLKSRLRTYRPGTSRD